MANQAPVALVMGSDSDLPKLENTLAVFKSLEIPLGVRVISAHRTPDELREWLDAAVPNGLKVIIAAAGMAATWPVRARRTPRSLSSEFPSWLGHSMGSTPCSPP